MTDSIPNCGPKNNIRNHMVQMHGVFRTLNTDTACVGGCEIPLLVVLNRSHLMTRHVTSAASQA
eukprot:6477608-Amphidinium_carterae.1